MNLLLRINEDTLVSLVDVRMVKRGQKEVSETKKVRKKEVTIKRTVYQIQIFYSDGRDWLLEYSEKAVRDKVFAAILRTLFSKE